MRGWSRSCGRALQPLYLAGLRKGFPAGKPFTAEEAEKMVGRIEKGACGTGAG